jgi:hypothetical protein
MTIYAIAIAVVLQINNVAGVPETDLDRARHEVTRLYHDIGVDVTWTSADAPRAAAPPTVRIVIVPFEGGNLQHREKPVMGAAVITDQGTSVAYVYYRQVKSQAIQHQVAAATILGSAIAHEVGHLLLPGGAGHSPTGLMRACWTREDFQRAEQGQLSFSVEQASRIRTRAALQPLVEHEGRYRAGQ